MVAVTMSRAEFIESMQPEWRRAADEIWNYLDENPDCESEITSAYEAQYRNPDSDVSWQALIALLYGAVDRRSNGMLRTIAPTWQDGQWNMLVPFVCGGWMMTRHHAR